MSDSVYDLIAEHTRKVVAEQIAREELLIYDYFYKRLGQWPTKEQIEEAVVADPDLYIRVYERLPYGGDRMVFFGTRHEARVAGWNVDES